MDSIPAKCTVLVIGGGPAGSYTAAALAREGIDTVILEADKFPRYHVGESMVSSIRHFLRFIDLDSTFDKYGFVIKTGAAFKLNKQKEAYTDFIVSAGPDAYAWNVVRSESDDLMFRHAEKCGAKIFDGVKVQSLEFVPLIGSEVVSDDKVENADPGRAVSATWSRKDGSSGVINFDYLVDASGRAGIVSTKYLKNRSFNQDLKNVANWGYWKGAISYGVGTPKEGLPFFEALQDGSGWCWFIPLHNGTTSVGVVMNQSMATDKKRAAAELNGTEYYRQCIQEAPGVAHLVSQAELSSDIKYASDWSYCASSYASPYTRIVGDAGAFVDPYFSSGVHLALSGALSAAVTICASIRGDCDEKTAYEWHSHGITERYTRFLLVVLTATKQIRSQDVPVMNNEGEDGFDNAFTIIRPVIQGRADVNDGLTTKDEVSQVVDFTTSAVSGTNKKQPGEPNMNGMNGTVTNGASNASTNDSKSGEWETVEVDALLAEEAKALKMAAKTFGDFAIDTFDGRVAKLERGKLGLAKVAEKTTEKKMVNGTGNSAQIDGLEALDQIQHKAAGPVAASA